MPSSGIEVGADGNNGVNGLAVLGHKQRSQPGPAARWLEHPCRTPGEDTRRYSKILKASLQVRKTESYNVHGRADLLSWQVWDSLHVTLSMYRRRGLRGRSCGGLKP